MDRKQTSQLLSLRQQGLYLMLQRYHTMTPFRSLNAVSHKYF